MKLRFLILSITLIALISCSGGGNPVAPPAQPFLSPGFSSGQVSPRVVYGIWMFDVSADHMQVNAVPLRLGEGHFNVRTFLEDGPCTNCLTVLNLHNLGDGFLDVTIRITHPFVGVDKFTGFDVRGTVIFPTTDDWPEAGLSWSNAVTDGGELLNADGWTTVFNPVDFEQGTGDPSILTYQQGAFATTLENASQLNAYKAFHIEPDRRPFFTDEAISKTYMLKLPAGAFRFGYVVDGSWAQPEPNPPISIPDDFPVEANTTEAYKISANVGEGFSIYGGKAACEIDVYDWQGTGSISSVIVESPDLFTGTVEAWLDTDYGTISRWMCTVENENLMDEGEYPFLISVRDTEDDPFLGPMTAYTVIAAPVGPPPAYPPGIYVDRDYPGIPGGFPENGTPEAPFRSITTGFIAAQPGDKIFVDPSPDPYNEQVNLQDDHYVLGENWRADGDSGQPVIEAMEFNTSVYGIAVSDLVIDNFEIRPGCDMMGDYLYGIFLDYAEPTTHQENVTIKNCLFTGERAHTGNNTGDEVICAQIYLTDNLVFDNNTITGVTVGSDQGGYFGGLHVDVCDGVTVTNNVITEVEFRNSFLGMHIWYSDLPVLVENNEVSHMVNSVTPTGFVIGWAINVIGYSDVTVKHNKVHHLGAPGQRLETVGLFFRAVGDGDYYNWNIENNLVYDLYAQDADNTYNSADCRGIMFRMNSYNNLDGLRIVNNTVDNLTSGEYVRGMFFDIGSSNILTNYEIENNIFSNIQGPAEPDSYYSSAAIYVWSPSYDVDLDYSLFYNVDVPDPDYVGVNLGPGVIEGEDPMYYSDYHLPLESPAQLGNPDYLDYDDTGPASGDPDDTDPETRSRMGAYGGPGGDW